MADTRYRVYNVRSSDGWTIRPHNILVSDEEVADACHGGPNARDVIAERLLEDHRAEWYSESHRPTGSWEAPIIEFETRVVEEVRPFGVEYVTLGTRERAYGGPEEGGWYYDVWTPWRTWIVPAHRADRCERLINRLVFGPEGEDRGGKGRHWTEDRHVRRGKHHAERSPRRRPHYC